MINIEVLPHAKLSILSVNWSYDLVKRSLIHHNPLLDSISIYSNNLQFVENLSNGIIIGNIHSGVDKCFVINNIKNKDPSTLIVYIGDSLNDILPAIQSGK